ncbi:MotA/TolQ/ExbB proton channel family protein [Stratiformator vulcanicus]|uniref:Biopolymer transport protein ExbB n=1 Tax=Stratiformator vulcanicus TaxID=2527980 RepID=A0A517R5H7_9PLAN|nr:MotA/TolQ/ExbB proton channel family protein [Stratiformator vulcanicus]QDT39148.1 Biopolymer transport protein ExbB [Stratiformator vulcanicus]
MSLMSRLSAVSWLVLLATVIAVGFNDFAWAQDADGGADPGAAAPAEPAAPAAVPADDGAGGETEEITQESFLSWMIRASGAFGLVLLILSFVMVALIMMNILQVRRANMLPVDFIEDFEGKLQGKDFQGAYELARTDDSVIARVLAAGLGKLNRGYAEAVEGMQEVGEDEGMAMEHRLSYLALISAIAPMIGLMGTVWGMIQSFQTIARSTTQPKPAELADGISTALFTTLEGLMVAIPAMVAYSLLRNRVNRFMLEVGIVSEGLMQRLSMAGKGRPASGGTAAATSPAAPQS